jgi:hypothetical protein
MSEEGMEHAVQQALAREGIAEEVLAAGQFNPRGHSGSMFVGGLAGGEIGGAAGSVGEAVGEVAGVAGGMRVNEATQGMPQWMLVGVTADAVYGFDGRSRSKTPGTLVFRAERAGLELEGNRIPLTHSKDVIEALSAS